MSISTPPPPAAPKKSGLGCLGCGCAVLALIVVLIVGAIGGICYLVYQEAIGLTTTTPTEVPANTGGNEAFTSAQQKISAFQQDVQTHKASSLHLTADEINAVIAHNPDMAKNDVRIHLTLTNDEGRIQACMPVDTLRPGLLPGRYFSVDTTMSVNFDSATKSIIMTPHAIQIGDKAFMGPGVEASQSSFDQGLVRGFVPSFNQSFNDELRKESGSAQLLQQAKTVTIKDGELVIETE